MIPPLPISVYPENTLEGMIARSWVSMICEVWGEEPRVSLELVSEVISDARKQMVEAGWPWTYQHNFLVQLRNDLTELTQAHPVTRQFIQLLTVETEFH